MAPDPIPGDAIFNQSPPLTDVNLFTSDAVLTEAVAREGGGEASEALTAFGQLAGSAAAAELARLANEHPPELRTLDAQGRAPRPRRVSPGLSPADGVQHDARAPLLDLGPSGEGGAPRPGAHVARCAGSYLAAQMEPGHCCPITMTHAAVATLRHEPALARSLLPRIITRSYDPRFVPWHKKQAITIGMGMTERQGGTDVRANTTAAAPIGDAGPRQGLCHHRPQMVSVGADVGRLPGAGANQGRVVVLLRAPLHPGRRGEPAQARAPQGQARQPLQRVGRGELSIARLATLSARKAGAWPPSWRW